MTRGDPWRLPRSTETGHAREGGITRAFLPATNRQVRKLRRDAIQVSAGQQLLVYTSASVLCSAGVGSVEWRRLVTREGTYPHATDHVTRCRILPPVRQVI
jgi:hypothetical protein